MSLCINAFEFCTHYYWGFKKYDGTCPKSSRRRFVPTMTFICVSEIRLEKSRCIVEQNSFSTKKNHSKYQVWIVLCAWTSHDSPNTTSYPVISSNFPFTVWTNMSNVFTIVQAERNETASQEKAEKERYRKKVRYSRIKWM